MSRTSLSQETLGHSKWASWVRSGTPLPNVDGYLQEWEVFFDQYASQVDRWHRRNAGYHKAIASLARFYIPPGSKVLEVGSGSGDLLEALQPERGLGIDISGKMVRHAEKKYARLQFRKMAAEHLDLEQEKFDFIVLSDLVGFLYDIRVVLERLQKVCHSGTKIVINWYSNLWHPILALAERVGLKYPQPLLNWTTVEDIQNLLYLSGFEIVHQRSHILLPKRVPLLATLLNRYLAHVPGFRWMCLTNWIVARPTDLKPFHSKPTVSVVCPCRNEEGNIEQLVNRLPFMGAHTELIFVEGHSKDNTLAECRRVAATATNKDIKVFVQPGRGKGDAVRLGFAKARGDILMILDADLSVDPEDLTQFYDALVAGKGEFINGSRLVYTKDPQAMRFLNLLGNKFFAFLLSNLLGQPIKDSLCGTKVLRSSDYNRIAKNRKYFGDFDPFGDFDLLFGAAKQNLKIVEVPIRYRQRTYGTTNISRFSHGWLLLRMCGKAAQKLLFILNTTSDQKPEEAAEHERV
jgi:ubiquinone/menaquinone biosynthesis C-methylase UbiE